LGQPFEVLAPGLNLKPYPSCRCTHTALDAMLALVEEHDISDEKVEKVDVRTIPYNTLPLIHSNPQSGLEGKFSMQFCMAAALLYKKVGMGEFTDEKVLNAQDLTRKVKMSADSTLEDAEEDAKSEYLPSAVTVRLKDGKEYSKRVNFPKGHPDVPMGQEEMLAKYRDCAGLVMSKEAVNRSIEMIHNLEAIQDLRSLADLLICSK
jgi:2-methylcitrate dehydratase PrpD